MWEKAVYKLTFRRLKTKKNIFVLFFLVINHGIFHLNFIVYVFG